MSIQGWEISVRTAGYGVAMAGAVFLLALIPGLSSLSIVSALIYWLVCIAAWPRINERNKRQIVLLLGGWLGCSILRLCKQR